MRSCLLALVAGTVFVFPVSAADRRHPEDATLHAVQFVDADVGYAVGDEGVIWKTIDGGKRWELLPTGGSASLRSIHMLSHLVGWVVGRDELPRGAGSVGIVLFTKDGGESWQRLLVDTVPGLNFVRFGDAENGYLVGDSSERYPTGVFITNDGGRKWRPLEGPRAISWLGGDFLNGKSGALAGAWSSLGTLRDGNVGKADVEAFGGRHIRGMQIRQAKSFAVGQGGLVLESRTLGAGWDFSKTNLSSEVMAAWDFHAVSTVGDKVWMVGRPGSAVLYSEVQGGDWKIAKTGQTLPLNGVHFFDEKRGWAVGAYGTILASADGGQSWTIQRRGGQRSAVLFVNARAGDLPADTVALLSGEQSLLTTALQVTGPDPKTDSWSEVAQANRFAKAHRLAGGVAAESLWQFPVPQDFVNVDKEALVKFWDRLHGDAAAQQLLRQLVLAIRTWQPDVVLTDHLDIQATGSAACALVAEALHVAYQQAADPKAFPEQIEQLGLQPWRVTRVYGNWDKRDGSSVKFDNSSEIAQFQATAAEYAAPAVALLAAAPPVIPGQRFFRQLDAEQPAKDKNLFAGVSFGPVPVCRRDMPDIVEPDEKLAAALKAQRQFLALVKNPTTGLAEPQKILDQLGAMLGKLPEDRGVRAAMAIGDEFVRQGQWELARTTYLEMVKRYPAHPLSVDACRWLIRHNASSAARRRQELDHFLTVAQKDDNSAAKSKSKDANDAGEILQAAFLENPAQLLHWRQGSLLLGRHLAGFGSLRVNEPGTQFCLQAASRQLGDLKTPQAFFGAFCRDCPSGPWHDLAAQELWLANGSGAPPRPAAKCRFTDKKPFLDGKLDDPCWQDHKPMVLRDAIHETAKEYPTEAMLSHDDKFLYIALRCKHPAGMGVPPAKERPRDADLRSFDRVSIILDLDRNYATYYHLQVDQRGCVCEDCWGDKRWNPQWFVAVRSEADGWCIEAAIPLNELTGDPIARGSAWACNVVRILPGRGIQAWSTPAGVEPRPEGSGLLVFERDN